MQPFGETVKILMERGNVFEVTIPTVPHVAGMVEQASAGWPIAPRIVHTDEEKWAAFANADAALAASGTVLLELALSGVPMISCYRPDWMVSALARLITVWSAALPNLVVDWPVVPEFYNQFLRPVYIARVLEQLLHDTPSRAAQVAGFAEVAARMATDRPSGELAAEAVLRQIGLHQ